MAVVPVPVCGMAVPHVSIGVLCTPDTAPVPSGRALGNAVDEALTLGRDAGTNEC